ncbi:hypothetical protein [Maricaulis parjimensis]|uniref:hypothetical protein n=1 Tax=Maricaulis parjimensis TaxID=144023 RepID=UPI00193A9804|nr:hypothetical protein [Maricaulis parjimensis]
MRFLCLGLLSAAWLACMAPASAQRTVMLDVCNDTGFRVATAAAYQTRPGAEPTLRTWFMIEPGACLEGALNGVAGDAVDIHVMSGEWRWPARSVDQIWCVGASGSTSLAAPPPCTAGGQARNFRTTPIELTGQRGAGGIAVGRVSWRIRCSDLDEADAHLCLEAPTDSQGMAEPVRTLEVCNLTSTGMEVAILEPDGTGNFTLEGVHWVEGDACGDLYRGFPRERSLMVAEVGRFHERQEGQFCLPIAQPREGRMQVEACAEGEAPVGFRMHGFGERTARYTAYVGR